MNKTAKFFIWIAVGLAALRLLSLPFTPLTDTTEARYAEIGRVMAESGNYITPFVDGVPFWGKPPLSFWTTAISYKIFGVNDFAAHFPHFLFLIGAAALLFFFVRRWRDESTAAITTAVLMTMPVFLYLAGGVMTDPALAFCMMLAMIGFYNAVNNKNIAPERSTGGWGYLFFVGLGLGLLAKGPLIFVLVGLPIFVYVLAKNKWRNMFRNVPIVTGTLLMLAIALPWYIMAERATPGFLEYFIIGEHFERYVTPNWAGDL
ncbi:MAG: glycosyltransferase family 39 protein, partial [Alphaproteobacteria bacterium]|nr:glycosyltransferase family 39 protein [Alphaproteobacteria bacterium]